MLKRMSLACAVAFLSMQAYAAHHVLDGRTVTMDQLWRMSQPGETVEISKEGWERLKAGYQAPIKAAEDGRDIYGLTVNYGALKDKRVSGGSVEEEPNRSALI